MASTFKPDKTFMQAGEIPFYSTLSSSRVKDEIHY